MAVRFTLILAIFAIAYSFLLFNLYKVQVLGGEYYRAQAASEELAQIHRNARRGSIYFTDKNGARLAVAITKDSSYIWANPSDIVDASEAAYAVEPFVDIPVGELIKIFSNEKSTFKRLADKVSKEVAAEVSSLHIPGVYTSVEPRRAYPFGIAAAHVLGYVGPRDDGPGYVGKYGVESYYNSLLQGVPEDGEEKEAPVSAEGKDVVLTIDPNIQFEVEKILAALVQTHGAKGGAVIVEEPRTGKLLAMAGSPTFDPNEYSKEEVATFINPTVQKLYEPGSIIKVLTMASGLDAGVISPSTTYVDKGSLTMNGRTIANYDVKTKGPYGKVTMSKIIEHSINMGAVFVGQQLGRDKFKEYFERFGLNEITGIGLPGEIRGNLDRLSPKERDIVFATASYGQGISATPLEVINAVSAIANGGVLMRPYMNAVSEPKEIRRVVGARAAGEITDMMVSAVTTAGVAHIPGYTLAGKTGTAFVPDFVSGGYTENVINTYVGFGPTKDPRFVILIKLDEPKGAPVAALTVVPAFRELAQFALNYYDIPPDELPKAN